MINKYHNLMHFIKKLLNYKYNLKNQTKIILQVIYKFYNLNNYFLINYFLIKHFLINNLFIYFFKFILKEIYSIF